MTGRKVDQKAKIASPLSPMPRARISFWTRMFSWQRSAGLAHRRAGRIDDQRRCAGLDGLIGLFKPPCKEILELQEDKLLFLHHLCDGDGPLQEVTGFGSGVNCTRCSTEGHFSLTALPTSRKSRTGVLPRKKKAFGAILLMSLTTSSFLRRKSRGARIARS